MKSCSRGRAGWSFCAFSISLRPPFRVLSFGNSQIWRYVAMALPQCAMAHFGSRVEASAKVFSDSVYWNECRRARPFSSEGCTSAAQLVGKSTLPSWPEAATPAELSARSEERRVGKEGRSLCDWSSDVCSSDLGEAFFERGLHFRGATRREIHFAKLAGGGHAGGTIR